MFFSLSSKVFAMGISVSYDSMHRGLTTYIIGSNPQKPGVFNVMWAPGGVRPDNPAKKVGEFILKDKATATFHYNTETIPVGPGEATFDYGFIYTNPYEELEGFIGYLDNEIGFNLGR